MGRPYEATVALLDEREDLEPVLEAVLARDGDGAWGFDDLDCDSGTFGELVSRDFVESVDEGYRLVEPEQTRAALEGDAWEPTPADDDSDGLAGSLALPSAETSRQFVTRFGSRLVVRDRSFTLSVLAALAFLFVMRSVLYRDVFRDGAIVLPGNDSYHFRYHVDQLLAADIGLLDASEAAEIVPTTNIFTYVLGWWLTDLFEGSPETSGFVIAWLPVVLVIAVAIMMAWMALAVTEDERIAIMSVLALAVMPGNAQYTLLGFFDHHAVDYLWLAVMATTVVWLARDTETRSVGAHLRCGKTWLVVAIFGVACFAAMMSWNGAPLLLLGVGIYAFFRSASDVRARHSPLLVALPLLGGLALATVLSVLLHSRAGWQETAVVYAPGVVFLGVASLAVISEAIKRIRPDPRLALVANVVAGLAFVLIVRSTFTDVWSRYRQRFEDDFLGREVIAETHSLFAPEFVFSFGPIQQFGLLIFFALPALAYVSWRCVHSHEPAWLVLVGYGWAGIGLMAVQVRFSGEFSPFGAIFAAVGIFWLLGWLGMARPLAVFGERIPRPLRIRETLRRPNQAVYVAFVIVIVLTVGILYSVVLMGALTINDEEYEAAAYIAEDTDDDEYVLSRWGRVRMYNYFAWGFGDSDRYARDTNSEFLSDSDPDDWYEEFSSGPYGSDQVGYIVVPDMNLDEVAPESAYNQLFFEYGSATQLTDGVGHFRLVYLTTHETQAVFEPVEGAVIVGEYDPGEVITVDTDVRVESETFTYTRRAQVAETGQYAIRVAYPGNYTLPDESEIEVTEEDVTAGNEVVAAE